MLQVKRHQIQKLKWRPGRGKKRVREKIEQGVSKCNTHHTNSLYSPFFVSLSLHTVRDFDLHLTVEQIEMSGEMDRRGVEEREVVGF